MASPSDHRVWPLIVGVLVAGFGLLAVGAGSLVAVRDRSGLHHEIGRLNDQHGTDADRIGQLETCIRDPGCVEVPAPPTTTTTTSPRSNGTTRTTQRPSSTKASPATSTTTSTASSSSTTTTAQPPPTTTTTRPCPTPVTAPVLGCPVPSSSNGRK